MYTTIRLTKETKALLDKEKLTIGESYENIILRLLDDKNKGEDIMSEECYYSIERDDCKVSYIIEWTDEEGELFFLDDANQRCTLDDLHISFVDKDFQKEYDEFLLIINHISESELNLLDYSADLEVEETIKVLGLTIKRIS